MEGFNQGREAVISPWLLNKEYGLQGARLEAGTQLGRLVERPKEGDVWTEVVGVSAEGALGASAWRAAGVEEGHAVCVCGGLQILPTPWGRLSGQRPI